MALTASHLPRHGSTFVSPSPWTECLDARVGEWPFERVSVCALRSVLWGVLADLDRVKTLFGIYGDDAEIFIDLRGPYAQKFRCLLKPGFSTRA
jgi:hypothetical protein